MTIATHKEQPLAKEALAGLEIGVCFIANRLFLFFMNYGYVTDKKKEDKRKVYKLKTVLKQVQKNIPQPNFTRFHEWERIMNYK